MGPTNYPLVVFDQEPAHTANPEDNVLVSPVCDGIRCLVGSRKSEPTLLYAVPNIPGLLEERVPLDHRIGSGSGSSDGDTNESRSDSKTEDRQTYGETRLGKWGIIGLVAMSLAALVKFMAGNRQPSAHTQPTLPPETIATVVDNEKSMSASIPMPTTISTSDTHAIVLASSPESDPIPLIAKPEEPTPIAEEPAPMLGPPAVEFVGEPEDHDGDESEKEAPSDMPRRKGPRRRKRGKKKKTDTVGPGAEQDEDEVVVKDSPDETPVLSLTPAPHIPSPPSSLLVSDTVLGA